MPEKSLHPAAMEESLLLKHCQVSFGRRSGPGGQRRNKTETAVQILHLPSGISASASERRSQAENRRLALRRLRLALAVQLRGYFDLRQVPSELFRSRCSRTGRLFVNPNHRDYPALLAEALDVIFALKLDPARAAMLLGCTTSQLLKLIKDCPKAWVALNAARQARHLPPLR